MIGPQLLVDERTGKLALPGRITRTLQDPQLPGTTPSFWATGWGTFSARSWSNTNPNAAPGSSLYTTAATVNALAGVRGASPMNSFYPAPFLALGMTLEGLCFDGDAGYGITVGWFSSAGGKGGITLDQSSGTTAASALVNDSTGASHSTGVQYRFNGNGGGGGLGGDRRNLTLIWAVHAGWFYICEDDQVITALDVSANVDINDLVYPAVILKSGDGAAHWVQWSQSSLFFNHN